MDAIKEINDLKAKVEKIEELGTFEAFAMEEKIEEDIAHIKADLYDLTAAIVDIKKILEANKLRA